MHTLTADELQREPQQLIDDARGHAVTVTAEGEPVLMSVLLGKRIELQAEGIAAR